MKKNRILSGVAATAAAALVLTGCAGGGDNAGGGESTDAVVTVNGSEPQNPLIPTNTNETGGGKILDLINATLINYDKDGKVVNELAESIEPNDDSTEWTIKIKPEQVFSDGSAITSDSFIKAWNYGANPKNGQLSSYFFEIIEGYSAEEGADVPELSGLKKVDDTTFTVKLNQPASDFGIRLGYSAYAPLPEKAFEDLEAYGEAPLASGPYMVKEGSWQHDVQIELVPNPDYKGDRKAKNGGVTIKFYAQQDAAYNDLLSGNLDVLDAVPDSAFGTFQDDLGDRAVNQPAAIFQSFAIPEKGHWAGEEGKLRRQAISHAIDRAEITKTIFDDTRTPASDFTSPVIDGFSESVKGNDVLEFDKAKAQELWAQADEISKFEGKFEIAYNADGGHDAWVEAVTNQVSNNLGIEAAGKPYPTFAELRDDVTNRTIESAFRTGWQADYPGLNNFLGPLYVTGAGSNDTDYSNPEFDKLIKEGDSESSIEAANKKYEEAQTILFADLPVVPLWYSNVVGGYADGVQNVEFGWNSVPLMYNVTK